MDLAEPFRFHAAMTVVYDDLGISGGMQDGIKKANALTQLVDCRKVPEWERIYNEWLLSKNGGS